MKNPLKIDPALLTSLTQRLDSPTLKTELPPVSIEPHQSFGGKLLTVNLGAELGVSVFNSDDDEDVDRVVLRPGEAAGPVPSITPPISRRDGEALVKYRASAELKASLPGQTLAVLGFNLAAKADGGGGVILADYRRHAGSEIVKDAVLADLAGMRASLRLEDVLDLREGEAVTHQVAGRLSASVTVSWADVLTGPVGPLTRLLRAGAPILVKVNAGATATLSVSFSDDFRVVFSREADDRWRVGLKKAQTRDGALTLALAVSARFADPGAITAILGPVVDAVIGQPLGKVEALLAKASLDSLTPAEKAIAQFLIERFGLDPVVATIDDLRKKVGAVKDDATGAVEAVAKAKVELGFAYQYRRTLQQTTILEAVLTRAALNASHAHLIRGAFDAALNQPGVTLVHFLYEKTTTVLKQWGFSLTLGKWLSLGATDAEQIQTVERRSQIGLKQVSYLAERSYKEA